MEEARIPRIDWLDYLKVFALLGVLLNHWVESMGLGAWFGEPSGAWAGLLERVPSYLAQSSLSIAILKTLAWIGDYAPGVFIFTSGFGLCWAVLYQKQDQIDWKKFLQRRLLRLFPLYILLHLFFFAASFAKNGFGTEYADPNFLLSILGIRITDELFFYINPSWWFIWLILQFYILFPLLYKLMQRVGTVKFLLLAFGLTLLSRLLGLAGIRYSESLYYWMLGIFFGTRLAEFCIGMVFAVMIKEGAQVRLEQLRTPKYILFSSITLLFFGLAFSFIKYGILMEYFLVTMGLCGLFYYVWKVVFEKRRLQSKLIALIGFGSYGIYLVHYIVIRFMAEVFTGEWQAVGLVTAILISFPIGIYLTSLMNWLIQKRTLDAGTLLPTAPAVQKR